MSRSRLRVLLMLALAVSITTVATSTAAARPSDPGARATGTGPAPLEQAREESGVKDRPGTRYELAAGVLRLSASELLAAARQRLEVSLTLGRDVFAGTLELTLPSSWIGLSGVSDLPHARVPATGRGAAGRAAVRRSADVVSFSFDGARSGDEASFELQDNGIPAGTYRLPYRWREAGGPSKKGALTVIFYAPTRETAENVEPQWDVLMRDVNATNDALTESETFLTVVPGNNQRFAVGANGGGGYNAWITNTGGAPFTKAMMSASIDAPGEAAAETTAPCCDPMSAADAAGNIWYGGLSDFTSAASPSRIVVARSAPGTTTFVSTVGLPVPAATTGTQDKPMMTIDNSPASPRFGRLYVVWNQPAGGGINIVMSQCNTRPGGVLNAANCDNATTGPPRSASRLQRAATSTPMSPPARTAPSTSSGGTSPPQTRSAATAAALRRTARPQRHGGRRRRSRRSTRQAAARFRSSARSRRSPVAGRRRPRRSRSTARAARTMAACT